MSDITHTVTAPTQRPRMATARIVARGTVLGRYEIVGAIGAGELADVWLGRATGHGGSARLLAIKTARASLAAEPRLQARCLHEGAIASGVRHRHVVDVLDVGEAGGVLYQVMSLVEGDSLAGLDEQARERNGQRLALGVTLSIVIDALRGLQAAHEHVEAHGASTRRVHRGVSARSILVDLDGVARVSDFGIASALEPVDPRADVFAMGVVLWEAMTGCRLVEGRDAVDPRTRVPDLPPAIVAVVMRALARVPVARHESAGAMAEALTLAARVPDIAPERRTVARTVEALVGSRVRTLVGETTANASSAPTLARRRASRAVLASIALVALVAFVLAVRSLASSSRRAPLEQYPVASSTALP